MPLLLCKVKVNLVKEVNASPVFWNRYELPQAKAASENTEAAFACSRTSSGS